MMMAINRKLVTIMLAVSAVLGVAIVLALAYFYYSSHQTPYGTPPILFFSNVSSLNTKDLNVSQGTILRLNLTFTSLSNKQLTIPIENLKLIAYSETIDYTNWDTSNWNTSILQERVFNYTFSFNQPTLQPSMSNSTILTIYIAEDAPLGRYALDVNFDTVKLIPPDGKSELSYGGSIGIEMIITPKPR